MIFIFDENFSKRLAEGLDLLEKSNPASIINVDVLSAEKLMGRRGATDEEIIRKLNGRGVIVTKDKDFKQIKLTGKAIQETGTKVLFFKYSKKMVLYWDLLTTIITYWEKIKSELNKNAPPYVYEFDIKGNIKVCHL